MKAVKELIETKADAAVKNCLTDKRNFSLVAGAGSGKTTSLIAALQQLRETEGKVLRRDDKRIACITYTNRAVEVISNRLDWDELFRVSTLHQFLWSEVKKLTPNIREALRDHVIPIHIAKKEEDDNGGQSKKAIAARERVASLKSDLDNLDAVSRFEYDDTTFSNYAEGRLNHDDVIDVAAFLISTNDTLRKIIGQKYPYIFVDEAQDTFSNVVDALNKLAGGEGVPIVGYFGDPMQQIYEKRAGSFVGPEGYKPITKEENFRCSCAVIDLLNAFRKDVKQFPAGKNADVKGSVLIKLVRAETPEGPRNRYTEEQIDRALARFDETLGEWEWRDRDGVKHLFLVRQMIARRLGFPKLHQLFTGPYASSRAQEDYEKGEHYLVRPFVTSLHELVQATRAGDTRGVIDILRKTSPAFDPTGYNAQRSLKDMKEFSDVITTQLVKMWDGASLGEILHYCRENQTCRLSDRLIDHLDRESRSEEYDSEQHSSDKGDWLADSFFSMTTSEIGPLVNFVNENTPLSTQHGVKGEEYNDVLVVFDDVEAAWNNYSFTKLLTPGTSGNPTEGQYDRSSKLAYVCFSRAEENLRILLFTPNPEDASKEIIANGLFDESQVSIDQNPV